jgi:hypothetical protein
MKLGNSRRLKSKKLIYFARMPNLKQREDNSYRIEDVSNQIFIIEANSKSV